MAVIDAISALKQEKPDSYSAEGEQRPSSQSPTRPTKSSRRAGFASDSLLTSAGSSAEDKIEPPFEAPSRFTTKSTMLAVENVSTHTDRKAMKLDGEVQMLLKEKEALSQLKKRQTTRTLLSGDSSAASSTRSSGYGDGPFVDDLRLICISNRLPVSLTRNASGKWEMKKSSGGLVSAMLGIRGLDMLWIGWPGTEVPEEDHDEVRALLREQGCVPVFLSQKIIENFYNGFSNNVLWPLFHYLNIPVGDSGICHIHEWEAYKQANRMFVDVVMQEYDPSDLVWVHDYQLMLMPKYLREAAPHMKIGWFLHTPFPSSEVYRLLPQRQEIIESLLSADLLGFHIYDYARHFISSCQKILGCESGPTGVYFKGRYISVEAFPIGIDPQKFVQELETQAVKEKVESYKRKFEGKIVLLGVDRLDYTKGLPQKLLAMERLLEKYPQWRHKVNLVQIAVPSRGSIDEYQKLARQVHELVGRINGRFGTVDDSPIHYIHQSVPFPELCALYRIANAALVTPVRDGMNLVSYEYVACQEENHGLLILSEFAGAAQSIGAAAILVNPWNTEDLCDAIHNALIADAEEKAERHRHGFEYICKFTSQYWASSFFNRLYEAESDTGATIPPLLPVGDVISRYHESERRLFLFGALGTLVELSDFRNIRQSRIVADVKELLTRLASDERNIVVVCSSRSQDKVESWLRDVPVWLFAENGAFRRFGGPETEWESIMDTLDLSWKDEVRDIFKYFEQRTPGSFVEEQQTHISWHWRTADKAFARVQAHDLQMHLWAGPLCNRPVEINSHSNQSIQVRPAGLSKLTCAHAVMEKLRAENKIPDMVVCIGDFSSKDEDAFIYFDAPLALDLDAKKVRERGSSSDSPRSDRRASPSDKKCMRKNRSFNSLHLKSEEMPPAESTFTCCLGKRTSSSAYHLESQQDVQTLLKRLVNASSE